MTNVKVSVIVPVYNVEEYLDKCLKSLLNQKFDDYEIIVVNDGSPDNSDKIIDKYIKKYPNKVYGYTKKNGGVGSARNYGLNKARGEYVLFVDSDDWVTFNYIRSLYNEAVSSNSDIVVCNMYKAFTDRKEVMLGKKNFSDNKIKDALISIPAIWNKIFKKELFVDNNIEFPNTMFAEDLATTTRLLAVANKVTYIDKCLYYYLQRDNSIMNQVKYNPKTSDIFESLSIMRNYFVKNNYYDKYKDEIEYLYISHLMHDYSLRVYRYSEGINDIKKVRKFMRDNFKKWSCNKYYKKESLKYRIVCKLIYFNQIGILRMILKK